MAASGRRIVHFRPVGGVLSDFRLPRVYWHPEWTPRPGQIMLLLRPSLGRVALSISLKLQHIDRRLGARRLIKRGLTTGRLITVGARQLMTDTVARLTTSRVLFRSQSSVPAREAPPASEPPDLPRVPTGATPARPSPKRPVASSLRSHSPYDPWLRR